MCTRRLVEMAYVHRPSFRLVREPVRVAMLVFACARGLYGTSEAEGDEGCRDCPRFYKNALRRESPLFRRLNQAFSPVFDMMLESLVPPEGLSQAREHALQTTRNRREERSEEPSRRRTPSRPPGGG